MIDISFEDFVKSIIPDTHRKCECYIGDNKYGSIFIVDSEEQVIKILRNKSLLNIVKYQIETPKEHESRIAKEFQAKDEGQL